MYKVFFNEQSININSNKESSIDYLKISAREELTPLLFHFFENEDDLYLSSEESEQVLVWLKEELNYIEAAGGIVENEDEDLLFIYRLEYWDLPKGKIETGESPEIASYREIQEECGIKSHQLQSHLTDTYHTYSMGGKMYLKKTFWYYFTLQDSSEDVAPQTEEDIELVSWFGEDEIQLALLDSYESIKEVYKAYRKL